MNRATFVLFLLAFSLQLATGSAQTTVFTYQGCVLDGGTNFNGTGQFQFALVTSTNANHTATATASIVMGGAVTGVTIINVGSGYQTAPIVTISGGGGTGATAHTTLSGGSVMVITVDNGGSGYFMPPAVTIAPPPPDTTYTTYWSNDGSSMSGGEPTEVVSLGVTNGLFTVVMGDATIANMEAISAALFNQPGLQLRIWFNDGTNGFAVLNPPQSLTPAPYAVYAANAGSVAAANIVGTVPVAQLPPNVITDGASGVNITGTFNGAFTGNGAGVTNVTASALAIPPGMALIPAGAFTMGDSLDGEDDATPTVSITVSAFYMDVNKVSLSQWQSVYYWATNNGYVFDNAGSGKAANNPVQTVNWYDAAKWCNARSQQAGLTAVYTYTESLFGRNYTLVYQSGHNDAVTMNVLANGYRLPTEAEREKAARGGLDGQRFPWGKVITQNLANYYGAIGSYAYDLGPNGLSPIWSIEGALGTSPVGSFAPNGYGLYDMAGNVSEWCWDWYGTPYGQPTTTNPTGPSTGSLRVLRGGNWEYFAVYARCACRENVVANYSGTDVGFRCVKGF